MFGRVAHAAVVVVGFVLPVSLFLLMQQWRRFYFLGMFTCCDLVVVVVAQAG